MRRRTLINNKERPKARLIQHVDTWAGDIVFYDSSSNSMLYYRFDDDGEDIIPVTCTPIGVVIIDYSLSEYEDKSVGVFGLKKLGNAVWGNTDAFITENLSSTTTGKEETQAIIEYRGEKPEGWTPDINNPDDFPAASLCNLYSTPGTKQGDWYLPSDNELQIVYVIYSIVASSLSYEFCEYYPEFSETCYYYIWLSTDFSNENAGRTQDLRYSGTFYTGERPKTEHNDVYPFIRIGGMKVNYGDIYISGGSVSDIPASGGESQVTGYTYSQTYGYGDSYTDGGVITSDAEISITSVSGDNLGTTETERTKLGESVLTVTLNGKTATMSYDVYQQANELIENTLRIDGGSRSDTQPANTNDDWMVASGGTYYYNAIHRRAYTSGTELEEDVSSQTTATLGNWNGSYTYGSISGINVVIPSRGTDTGSERYQEVNFSYNGLTARRQQGQQANSRWETSRSGGSYSYGNVSAGSITNGWIGAGGGTGTGYAGNGSQSWSRTAITTNYSYTSGATSSAVTTAASSGTNTVAPSASSYTASANSKGTTVSGVTTVGSKYITWSANGKSTGGTIYVLQAANAVTSRTWLNGTPQFNVQTTISNLSGSYLLTGNGDCAAGNQHQIKCKYSTTCSFTITFKALAKGTFTSGSTGPVELTSYNQSIQSDASIGLTVTGSYPTYNCTLSRLNEGNNFSSKVFYASICFSNACSSDCMLKIYRNKY